VCRLVNWRLLWQPSRWRLAAPSQIDGKCILFRRRRQPMKHQRKPFRAQSSSARVSNGARHSATHSDSSSAVFERPRHCIQCRARAVCHAMPPRACYSKFVCVCPPSWAIQCPCPWQWFGNRDDHKTVLIISVVVVIFSTGEMLICRSKRWWGGPWW